MKRKAPGLGVTGALPTGVSLASGVSASPLSVSTFCFGACVWWYVGVEVCGWVGGLVSVESPWFQGYRPRPFRSALSFSLCVSVCACVGSFFVSVRVLVCTSRSQTPHLITRFVRSLYLLNIAVLCVHPRFFFLLGNGNLSTSGMSQGSGAAGHELLLPDGTDYASFRRALLREGAGDLGTG